MNKPMGSHSERVVRLTVQAINMFIDEALAVHQGGADLRAMHDAGDVRWRLAYDEASGLISLGALMPTGELVPVGAAITKPAPDLPVEVPMTLN